MNLWDVFLSVLRGTGGVTITERFSWTGYRKEKNVPPKYTFFTEEEVKGLDENFCAKLDLARKASGIPFIITSGLRTLSENEQLAGAVADSAHLKGLAVDLLVENSHEVWKVIAGLSSAGINRIGIYVGPDWQPRHVHCDVDPDKVPEVIFVKQEQN